MTKANIFIILEMLFKIDINLQWSWNQSIINRIETFDVDAILGHKLNWYSGYILWHNFPRFGHKNRPEQHTPASQGSAKAGIYYTTTTG